MMAMEEVSVLSIKYILSEKLVHICASYEHVTFASNFVAIEVRVRVQYNQRSEPQNLHDDEEK